MENLDQTVALKTITAVISLFVLATLSSRADSGAGGPRQRLSMDLNVSVKSDTIGTSRD